MDVAPAATFGLALLGLGGIHQGVGRARFGGRRERLPPDHRPLRPLSATRTIDLVLAGLGRGRPRSETACLSGHVRYLVHLVGLP